MASVRPTKADRPARLRLVLPEGVPFPIEGAVEVEIGAPSAGGHGGGGHGGGGHGGGH